MEEMNDTEMTPNTELFTASRVEQAVLDLSRVQVPSRDMFSFVENAQKSKAAWTFSWQLLQSSKDESVQFFCALCLQERVSKDWTMLTEEERRDIRHRLKITFMLLSSAPNNVKNKLLQVMCTAALLESLMSKEAPHPVQYALDFFSSSDRQHLHMDACQGTLDLLTLLPQAYGSLEAQKQKEARSKLQTGVPQVVDYIKTLTAVGSSLSVASQKQTLRCAEQWVDFTADPQHMMPLMGAALQALESDTVFDEAVDLVIKVFRFCNLQRYPRMLCELLQKVNMVKTVSQKAVANRDTDKMNQLCHVVVTVMEEYSPQLIHMVATGGREKDIAVDFLRNTMVVGFPPGRFLLHEDVSILCLDVWAELQDSMQMADLDAEKFGCVKDVMTDVFTQLLHILIHKIQYPELTEGQLEEFESYREKCGETLLTCFTLLGQGVVQCLHHRARLVVDDCQKNGLYEWQEMEAIFAALGFIGAEAAAVMPESEHLRDIIACVPRMDSPHPVLLATAVRLIGTFSGWLAVHCPALTQSMLPVVQEAMRCPQSAPAAIRTLLSLVQRDPASVRASIPTLMAESQRVLRTDWLGQGSRVALMMCQGALMTGLSLPETEQHLGALIEPVIHSLQRPDTVEEDILQEVQLMSALLSGMNSDTSAGEAEVEKGKTMDGSHFHPNLVFEVLKLIMPTIQGLVHKWASAPLIVQGVSELFTTSLAAVREDFLPLADAVTTMMVDMYRATFHSAVLDLVTEMLTLYHSDTAFTGGLQVLLKNIIDRAVHSFEKMSEADPEAVQAFNIFMNSTLGHHLSLLLASDVNLDHILQIGIFTIKTQKVEYVVKSGCYLVSGFLRGSVDEAVLKAVVEANLPRIVQTVMEIIFSGPGQREVEMVVEIIQVCCRCQLSSFLDSLRRCLSQPSLGARCSSQDRENFVSLLISNQRKTVQLRQMVLNFSQRCRLVEEN